MTVSVYYVPFPGQANAAARMTALAAVAAPPEVPKPAPDGTRGIVLLHSAALGTDAIYHDDGTLTQAQYLADPIFAADVAPANALTIEGHLDTYLATIETWITNNPNGAALTSAQTLALAKGLAGLIRIVRQNTASIGQA